MKCPHKAVQLLRAQELNTNPHVSRHSRVAAPIVSPIRREMSSLFARQAFVSIKFGHDVALAEHSTREKKPPANWAGGSVNSKSGRSVEQAELLKDEGVDRVVERDPVVPRVDRVVLGVTVNIAVH